MSRVAKTPIVVPNEVDVSINDRVVTIKGKNSKVTYTFHPAVKVRYVNNILTFFSKDDCVNGWVQAGTTRAILNSMIVGVTKGFSKKLQLIGVGYRATIKDNTITLSLGFSHSINYRLPIEITAELPSQTEIVLRGANKQVVGQVAANLRAYRPPEPYKGKGIRYVSESIRVKEAKKK